VPRENWPGHLTAMTAIVVPTTKGVRRQATACTAMKARATVTAMARAGALASTAASPSETKLPNSSWYIVQKAMLKLLLFSKNVPKIPWRSAVCRSAWKPFRSPRPASAASHSEPESAAARLAKLSPSASRR